MSNTTVAGVTPTVLTGGCSSADGAHRFQWLSSAAFTLMFAAWLMFGVLGGPAHKKVGDDRPVARHHRADLVCRLVVRWQRSRRVAARAASL